MLLPRLEIITIDLERERLPDEYEFKVKSKKKRGVGKKFRTRLQNNIAELPFDVGDIEAIIKDYKKRQKWNMRNPGSRTIYGPKTPFDLNLHESLKTNYRGALLVFRSKPNNWYFGAPDPLQPGNFREAIEPKLVSQAWRDNFGDVVYLKEAEDLEVQKGAEFANAVNNGVMEICIYATNEHKYRNTNPQSGEFEFNINMMVAQSVDSQAHVTPITIDPKIRNTP